MKVVTDAQPLGGTAPAQPTKAFRLTSKRHSHNGVVLAVGDVVHLTKTQASAFADRFEAVDPDADFEVHDEDDVKDDESDNVGAGNGTSESSQEAQQAQRDKKTAETKAGRTATGDDPNGPTRTIDGAKGTLHADPDGTADGRPAKKGSKSKDDSDEESEKKKSKKKNKNR